MIRKITMNEAFWDSMNRVGHIIEPAIHEFIQSGDPIAEVYNGTYERDYSCALSINAAAKRMGLDDICLAFTKHGKTFIMRWDYVSS